MIDRRVNVLAIEFIRANVTFTSEKFSILHSKCELKVENNKVSQTSRNTGDPLSVTSVSKGWLPMNGAEAISGSSV